MNDKPSNKLNIPKGISTTGPVENITEAYVGSVMNIPEMLSELNNTLMEISDSLALLALYVEKKGLVEGVLHNDDLDNGDEDGKPD